MIFRVFLLFLLLAAGTSFLLFAACCTGFFNEQRRKRIARNSFLALAGSIVAATVIGALFTFNL
jgi:small neutral amino acid transporter SnatA (MarC family)